MKKADFNRVFLIKNVKKSEKKWKFWCFKKNTFKMGPKSGLKI